MFFWLISAAIKASYIHIHTIKGVEKEGEKMEESGKERYSGYKYYIYMF